MTEYNKTISPNTYLDKVLGTLVGGAIVDTLGAPLEFVTLDTIL